MCVRRDAGKAAARPSLRLYYTACTILPPLYGVKSAVTVQLMLRPGFGGTDRTRSCRGGSWAAAYRCYCAAT
eukprot:2537522-Pyramimonas_sp.AAC.2